MQVNSYLYMLHVRDVEAAIYFGANFANPDIFW